MEQYIETACQQATALHEGFCRGQGGALTRLAARLAALFAEGGQLLVAGHGQLSHVAQLLAVQFSYKLEFDRPVLPALCLGSDPLLSQQMLGAGLAEQYLVRHYRAINSEEHLLLVFSDGRESPELSALIEEVKDNDQPVYLLSGDGQRDPLLKDNVDACLDFGCPSPARLIELAQFAGHLLCGLVEKELFGR